MTSPPEVGVHFETDDGEEHVIHSVEPQHEQSVATNVSLGITTNQFRYFVRDESGLRWAVEWDGDRWEGRRRPPRV